MTLVACPNCGTQVTAGEAACPFCGADTLGATTGGIRYAHQWETVLLKLRQLTAPKYRVKSILGYGGMAGVYLAEEPRLGRTVAIKVMSPALMLDPSLIDRFVQEARTIAQLTHPNIITIYEVDEREDLHYFVMRHISGRNLGQVMAESSIQLPINVVRAWLYQIGDALGYAHGLGIVHRDVKPSNVLLDARGNALVTDFGIAKVADEPSLTKTGMLVGSPEYMSPEQCSSGRVTGASDQYSLGVVAFQMLTGQPPFRGPTLAVLQAHLTMQPPSIRDFRPDCPDDLLGAVSRMMQKDPDDRWPTLASAVAAAGAGPPGVDDPVRGRMEGLSAPTSKIQVRDWPSTMMEGGRARIETGLFDATDHELAGRRIEWSSDDPLIATVLPDGTLLARSPGSTQVTAISGGAAAVLAIEVEADLVPGLEIRPASATLGIGDSLALEAVVHDFDGKRLDGRAVLWSSQDAEVARVGPDGVVEGLHAGSILITASTGQKTATITVEVSATAKRSHRSDRGSGPRAVAGLTPTPGPGGPARTGAGESSSRRPLVIGLIAAAVIVAAVLPFALRSGGSDQPSPIPAPGISPTPATPGPGAAATTDSMTLAANGPATPDSATVPAGSDRPAQVPAEPPAQPPVRPVPETTAATRPPATRQQAAANAGAGAAAATDSADAAVTPPRPPAPATFRLGSGLPADAVVTLRNTAGTTQPVTGGSATVPAGTWFATVTAPGYRETNEQIVLSPGETRTWSPRLEALPAQPKPETSPAAADRTADQAAVGAAIRDFVTALGKRDGNRVVPLLPADARDVWKQLLASRAVTEFSASLRSVGETKFDGDSATADLVIDVSFRSNNQTQAQLLRYTGSFQKAGAAWRIVSLRQTGG